MKQLQTIGIVLARTNYGEADRIITVLTPYSGKLRLMARGVRKANSKVAGGIELFSVSDITYIQGRGEIGTLFSARLRTHYGRIIGNIERVQLGYDLIKMLNKATEDQPEAEYFGLLEQIFVALDDNQIDAQLVRLWFECQLLRQSGYTPNLKTDTGGRMLDAKQNYNFDIDFMAFTPHSSGQFKAYHIKTMRLLFSRTLPSNLAQVQGINMAIDELAPLTYSILRANVRV